MAKQPTLRQLLTTPAAAERLGIKPEPFRQLMKRLGIDPASWYTNPHYRSGSECPLWTPESVERLVGGPEVGEVVARTQRLKDAKESKPQSRVATFARRFPDWRAAVQPAAEALFNLNRYAKWPTCRREHKKEIYDLKNGFLELLCRLGHATEVKLHEVKREGLKCHRCNGTSAALDELDWDEPDDEGREGGSSRGGGSGWFKPAGTLTFVAFRFEVSGHRYSWHQPEELVTWEYTLTENVEAWVPEPEPKALNLTPAKFAEAKALVRWVTEQAKKK